MALVMTVVILSMLLILTVGFLSTMRIEKGAAASYEESQRTKLVAQGAVAHAIDILRTNIPEPARISESWSTAPGENWAVNPGRLSIFKDSGPKFVALHTGEVQEAPNPNAPRDADSYDLNRPLPGQTTPMITGRMGLDASNVAPPMRVRWVNLPRDPSASPSKENPLVGRYAFWIDDESSKINFNVALGKPAGTGKFATQQQEGFMPPLFDHGDTQISASGAKTTAWALGRPQSINLDVLFTKPNQLLADKLLAHTFLHGFARYPEAIMDYINVPSPQTWFDENKFNLTPYSRAPEFNVFGKSRFFTTLIPLSLEAGPNYQMPFIFDPANRFAGNPNEVLHLNALLGSFGFGNEADGDEEGGPVSYSNLANRAQMDALYDYLSRPWPGYGGSFVEKYGDKESWQIALNMLLMARMATAPVAEDALKKFSFQWGQRTTSVNFSPPKDTMPGETPERMYWRINTNEGTKLMLPQMPGPYITEIRLIARAVDATRRTPPEGNPAKLVGVRPRYLEYYLEAEYYMEPFGPVVDITRFPVMMDYFDLLATSGGVVKTQRFMEKNWHGPKTQLNRFVMNDYDATKPLSGKVLGPNGSTFSNQAVPNRLVVRSPILTVGSVVDKVPNGQGAEWTPQIFSGTNSTADITFKFRPGMGLRNMDEVLTPRPRQMIPLGESTTDTLDVKVTVSLNVPAGLDIGPQVAASWQISDPRLSSDKNQWIRTGPAPIAQVGTMGAINSNEPADISTEKSKMRYLQRAPNGAKIAGYEYGREDEYDPRSRIASPGYWSTIHTGMQSGKPWQTLNFADPATVPGNGPPDWLLLDLFGATYPMVNDQWKIDATLPDQFSAISYMNSTAGQVNLNSRIYPQTPMFQPPARRLPLQAVFQHVRSPGANSELIDGIEEYQQNDQPFAYVGELAKVTGYAGASLTQWQRESFLRNMAGCLTTKSNTFGVWGVAQVVKKVPKNKNYERFENGDRVTGEKRFYALVERYVWTGNDGVPGNGHTTNGVWDRLALQNENITLTDGLTDTLFQLPGSPPLMRTRNDAGQLLQRLALDANGTYPLFDGPERVGMSPYFGKVLGNVRYTYSTLEQADNPPQAVIKYRVVYFKYLDE